MDPLKLVKEVPAPPGAPRRFEIDPEKLYTETAGEISAAIQGAKLAHDSLQSLLGLAQGLGLDAFDRARKDRAQAAGRLELRAAAQEVCRRWFLVRLGLALGSGFDLVTKKDKRYRA